MKIKKVIISHFKKFDQQVEIELEDSVTLFIGPNNSGKTTVLQALSLWGFLLNKWKNEGAGKKERGLMVNRLDNIPLSVKETNYIWNNIITKQGNNKVIPIEIVVEGEDENDKFWKYGFSLKHQSKETFTFSPLDTNSSLPIANITYLPPFSGIKQNEQEYANEETLWKSIYQGLPGDVLRNILVQLQHSKKDWECFKTSLKNLFSLTLKNIESKGDIFVYYEISASQIQRDLKKYLEINTLGSGTLQVILLFAFLYWNKSNLILLDEPDSHEHSFLQREVFSWIKKIAEELGIQVIISTHSEVFIDATDTKSIISFVHPSRPKKVFSGKNNIKAALQNVSQYEAVLISEKKFLLITENDTDIKILKEWATLLKIEIDWKNVFIRYGAQSETDKVFNIINYLKAVEPDMKAFWIRDGDCPRTENFPPELKISYWEKPEIENYLFDKNILLRFLEKEEGETLFYEDYKSQLEEFFHGHSIVGTDFSKEKGSVFLEKLFQKIYRNQKKMPKKSFYRIAKIMQENEIPEEIKEVLETIFNFTKNDEQ